MDEFELAPAGAALADDHTLAVGLIASSPELAQGDKPSFLSGAPGSLFYVPPSEQLTRLDETPIHSEVQALVESDDILPSCYQLVRSCTLNSDPKTPVASAVLGLRSKLERQASVPASAKRVCDISGVRGGVADLNDGMHVFVVMVGEPYRIRLLHEQDLLESGWQAGHSSLVSRREFSSMWASEWRCSDPETYRCTVIYAGELEYQKGVGVISWNNCSGHYRPDSEDHVLVQLNPSAFKPVELP
jgi:hypothetical protein